MVLHFVMFISNRTIARVGLEFGRWTRGSGKPWDINTNSWKKICVGQIKLAKAEYVIKKKNGTYYNCDESGPKLNFARTKSCKCLWFLGRVISSLEMRSFMIL